MAEEIFELTPSPRVIYNDPARREEPPPIALQNQPFAPHPGQEILPFSEVDTKVDRPTEIKKKEEGGGKGKYKEKEKEKEKVPSLDDETVTKHTASLWKYKPVPRDGLDPMPEYRKSFLAFDDTGIIAARVRGKKHKHEGTNCDDWFEIDFLSDIAIVAVADGAGSKMFSRVGAREACGVAVGYLHRSLEKILTTRSELREDLAKDVEDEAFVAACQAVTATLQDAAKESRRAVEMAYYRRLSDRAYKDFLGREITLSDFATTLLLTVVVPVGKIEGDASVHRERLIVTCQIGDGMVAALDTNAPFDKAIRLLGKADSGDFSGETEFLTTKSMAKQDSLERRTKVAKTRSNYLFLMTDGVADDYFPNEKEMPRLYFDLAANGIIKGKFGDLISDFAHPPLSTDKLQLLRKTADPVSYPWINDPEKKVALQYTKNLLQKNNMSLKDLWQQPELGFVSSLDTGIEGDTPEEKLKVWLDNYVERGSFDDRTLVILEMGAMSIE